MIKFDGILDKLDNIFVLCACDSRLPFVSDKLWLKFWFPSFNLEGNLKRRFKKHHEN